MKDLRSRLLFVVLALSLLAAVAGMAGLDQRIARILSPDADPLSGLVTILDTIALKHVSSFLLGALIVLAGAALRLAKRRHAGTILLYVGTVQFLATTIADLSKPLFGRLRPYEAAAQQVGDAWFAGANSFPSGHAAFYAGLVLPILMVAPRIGALLLPIPVLVAAQRVLSLDHYLSDVAVSLAMAAVITLALRRVVPELRAPGATPRLADGAASARST